jgi:hypothetical protein
MYKEFLLFLSDGMKMRGRRLYYYSGHIITIRYIVILRHVILNRKIKNEKKMKKMKIDEIS